MRRREFIKVFFGSAVWPLAARAQQAARLPTIGYMGAGSQATWSTWTAAFVKRMRELGWIEGRTVTIEYRWAEGRRERFDEIAAEFVRLKVDVIVTVGSAVPAVTKATSTIPIVFAIAVDPVGTGMVASLARPGGNVTGLTNQAAELPSKRIELLRQLFPDLHRLAVIANVSYAGALEEVREVQAVAARLELRLIFSKSGAPRTSRPPSTHSKVGRRRCMCARTLWSMPTILASTPWRWARGCRPSMGSVTFSMGEA